jgi:hypothetical protein
MDWSWVNPVAGFVIAGFLVGLGFAAAWITAHAIKKQVED